jgi:hypothetical protein
LSSDSVLSGLLPGRKVGGPEDSLSPSFYLVVGRQFPCENDFPGLGVYERESLRIVRLHTNYQRLFLRAGIVADLVNEDPHLGRARQCECEKCESCYIPFETVLNFDILVDWCMAVSDTTSYIAERRPIVLELITRKRQEW